MAVNGLIGADHEIEMVEDVHEALRRASSGEERVIVGRDGQPLAAVIPLIDLQLLLQLEEEELDRIDAADVRARESDPDEQETIPLERVKAELGL